MIPSQLHFLLVSEATDHSWQNLIADILSTRGTFHVASEAEVEQCLDQQSYQLIIIDATVVADCAAMIRMLRSRQPSARIVVTTASPTWARAREAFLLGAIDYTIKSRVYDDMAAILWAALDKPLRFGET